MKIFDLFMFKIEWGFVA